MSSISLYTEISSLPDNLKIEVSDFIDFLITKKKLSKRNKKREAGFLKGKIEISSNFDEPLEDFKDYM